MEYITRFAPSPTGLLHIGNARTALICYLFTKAHNGKFMLRLDDTDIERSKDEFSDAIQEDLEWLGLDWDIFSRQSDRMARYNEIKEKLYKDGRLYPCYETAQELDIKRKMQLNRGLPPIYDRTSLKLNEAQIKQYESEGRKPHWRFKMDESKTIEWEDLIKGNIKFEARNLGDPILIRESGAPTYLLPSAIDDMDYKISHIVRGEDHVTNTAIQIQIFEALGSHIPVFAHQSLIRGKEGKISKREGGFDIRALREQGIEAMTINSFLARLGTSEPIEAFTNIKQIISGFDIKKCSTSSAIYDFNEIDRLNAKVLHITNYADVKTRPEIQGVNEEFYLSVRPNLTNLQQIKDWWDICNNKITPIVEDMELLNLAISVLPEGKWDEHTWSIWIDGVKKLTNKKGKELFMPIRKAITARETGPELKNVLPLIGREKVLQRLQGKIA